MSVEYLMEDQREAGRLAAKVDPERWVRTYLAPVMSPGAAVLDVGAGPGHIAAAVRDAWPDSTVVAFDGNAARLASGISGDTGARGRGTMARCCGDARRLPFADGVFDVAYCRLMLQYVAEREQVVAQLARVVRPGGRVVLFDLDGQLEWHDPEPPPLRAVLDAVIGAMRATGFDPYTGRSLYRLARRAGFTGLQVRVEPYHLIVGRIDPVEREQWRLKLDIARPAVARALGSAAAADEAVAMFLDHLDDEDTLTYSNAFTVTGRRA